MNHSEVEVALRKNFIRSIFESMAAGLIIAVVLASIVLLIP